MIEGVKRIFELLKVYFGSVLLRFLILPETKLKSMRLGIEKLYGFVRLGLLLGTFFAAWHGFYRNFLAWFAAWLGFLQKKNLCVMPGYQVILKNLMFY
jgi:hypothetical protein